MWIADLPEALSNLVKCRDPVQQAFLELGRVQRREDGVEPIVRRDATAEVEDRGQPIPLLASPGGDRDEVIGPGDDGADGDGDDVDERVNDLAPAWVGQVGEMILKASRVRCHDQKPRTTIRPSSTRLMSEANRTSRLSQIT